MAFPHSSNSHNIKFTMSCERTEPTSTVDFRVSEIWRGEARSVVSTPDGFFENPLSLALLEY